MDGPLERRALGGDQIERWTSMVFRTYAEGQTWHMQVVNFDDGGHEGVSLFVGQERHRGPMLRAWYAFDSPVGSFNFTRTFTTLLERMAATRSVEGVPTPGMLHRSDRRQAHDPRHADAFSSLAVRSRRPRHFRIRREVALRPYANALRGGSRGESAG